jgi:hypothetical protein
MIGGDNDGNPAPNAADHVDKPKPAIDPETGMYSEEANREIDRKKREGGDGSGPRTPMQDRATRGHPSKKRRR